MVHAYIGAGVKETGGSAVLTGHWSSRIDELLVQRETPLQRRCMMFFRVTPKVVLQPAGIRMYVNAPDLTHYKSLHGGH